jgi:hypothetical protein
VRCASRTDHRASDITQQLDLGKLCAVELDRAHFTETRRSWVHRFTSGVAQDRPQTDQAARSPINRARSADPQADLLGTMSSRDSNSLTNTSARSSTDTVGSDPMERDNLGGLNPGPTFHGII